MCTKARRRRDASSVGTSSITRVNRRTSRLNPPSSVRSPRRFGFRSMQRLWQRIDRWLFEEYRTDAVSLGIFRILFGCYLVLRTLPLGYWIRDVPSAAFCPPVSLAAFFQGYPPHWVIVALNAAT